MYIVLLIIIRGRDSCPRRQQQPCVYSHRSIGESVLLYQQEKKGKLGSSTHQTPLPFSSSLRHHKYSIFDFCSRHQKKKREGKKKRGTSQPAERGGHSHVRFFFFAFSYLATSQMQKVQRGPWFLFTSHPNLFCVWVSFARACPPREASYAGRRHPPFFYWDPARRPLFFLALVAPRLVRYIEACALQRRWL